MKKEKFGCNGSHTGPDYCKLAPEDGRVQQKYRGIYVPLPPVDSRLWSVLIVAWGLFRLGWIVFAIDWGLFTFDGGLSKFDGGLGHALDKFAQLGLGQRADFGVDRIAAFEHD